MSSTLMWRPSSRESYDLPLDLKEVVSRKLWNTDGSCGGAEVTVNSDLIPYLEGIRDAGINGAQELIDAINQHGDVVLWHEH